MAVDISQTIATVIASAVGTLVAGALGYRYAIAKFRQERTFDRQLDWYDRATKALHEAAAKINWAMASEVAGLAFDEKRKLWTDVHGAISGLRALEAEAEMYATPEGYEALCEALRDVGVISRAMMALPNWAEPSGDKDVATLYEICEKLLRHAASRLSDDVREHLGLPLIAGVGAL